MLEGGKTKRREPTAKEHGDKLRGGEALVDRMVIEGDTRAQKTMVECSTTKQRRIVVEDNKTCPNKVIKP